MTSSENSTILLDLIFSVPCWVVVHVGNSWRLMKQRLLPSGLTGCPCHQIKDIKLWDVTVLRLKAVISS